MKKQNDSFLNLFISNLFNKEENKERRRKINTITTIIVIILFFFGLIYESKVNKQENTLAITNSIQLLYNSQFDLSLIPEFDGTTPYVVINNNIPLFTDEEKATTEEFENYSDLDLLGRCGLAFANICQNLMPIEERGSIGMIKPTGWHIIKYDFIDGKYLYNRCHLIGYQLAGENANEKNLITGTRYLNVEGMLPFENQVAEYVKKTNNHILYRVTPIFKENELLARGVTIEAYSVEDNGEGICFYVYCYNNQPNVNINYETGEVIKDEE